MEAVLETPKVKAPMELGPHPLYTGEHLATGEHEGVACLAPTEYLLPLPPNTHTSSWAKQSCEHPALGLAYCLCQGLLPAESPGSGRRCRREVLGSGLYSDWHSNPRVSHGGRGSSALWSTQQSKSCFWDLVR